MKSYSALSINIMISMLLFQSLPFKGPGVVCLPVEMLLINCCFLMFPIECCCFKSFFPEQNNLKPALPGTI